MEPRNPKDPHYLEARTPRLDPLVHLIVTMESWRMDGRGRGYQVIRADDDEVWGDVTIVTTEGGVVRSETYPVDDLMAGRVGARQLSGGEGAALDS